MIVLWIEACFVIGCSGVQLENKQIESRSNDWIAYLCCGDVEPPLRRRRHIYCSGASVCREFSDTMNLFRSELNEVCEVWNITYTVMRIGSDNEIAATGKWERFRY